MLKTPEAFKVSVPVPLLVKVPPAAMFNGFIWLKSVVPLLVNVVAVSVPLALFIL